MTTEIQYIEIKSLNLNPRNPRQITTHDFNRLCEYIKEDPKFFEMRPCLVNKTEGTLIVYAGHQRIRAAKKLGWKNVPCIIEENVSETIQKKRILRDNLHAGTFDFDLLAADYEIPDLLNEGITLDEITSNLEDEPKKEEKEKKDNTKECPQCGHIF